MRKHGLPRYPKIALLREKLSRKAKEEPQFRFYCLYGQLLREDVLKCAYEAVRANQGAPGVDGMSFWRIEHDTEGVDGFLGNILRELKDKTYTHTNRLAADGSFRHSRIVRPVVRLNRRLRKTSLDHPHCWAMSAIGYPGLRRSEKARSRRWRLISSRIEDPVA